MGYFREINKQVSLIPTVAKIVGTLQILARPCPSSKSIVFTLIIIIIKQTIAIVREQI
jgi:hypothetical protein